MKKIIKDKKLGYILEYAPWHPNAKPNGYEYQHRLVLERKIGRLLRPGECGHHKNKNKEDNRPENLELTTQNKHARMHMIEKYDTKMIELKCKTCGNAIVRSERSIERRKPNFCSSKCQSIGSRKCIHPTKKKLAELISKYSWCAIGRMFDVSDNAVRKWARKYQLI